MKGWLFNVDVDIFVRGYESRVTTIDVTDIPPDYAYSARQSGLRGEHGTLLSKKDAIGKQLERRNDYLLILHGL
jgi:hypothetical protein